MTKAPTILPEGTPWWGYLIAILIPILLGSGGAFGVTILSASDVQASLYDHLQDESELLKEQQRINEKIIDTLHVNSTNILLLCQAQGLSCITD